MMGNGSISRRSATITVGQLREHLKNMNEETPIVIEGVDGKKFNLRAASDPKASDLPLVVLLASDDYSATAVGM